MLLWALGGLGNVRYPLRDFYYSPELIWEIRRIAAKPQSDYGEIHRLAERTGRSANSLAVMICKVRKGQAPRNWAERTKR